MVVHQNGHLHRIRRRVLRLGHALTAALPAVLRRNEGPKVLRPVDAVISKDLRQHHGPHCVAEMGGVIKIPAVAGKGRTAEIPEVHHPGHGGSVPGQRLLAVSLQLGGIGGTANHRQIDSLFLAHVPDGRQVLHTLVQAGHFRLLRPRPVLEVSSVSGLVNLPIPDFFHIPHPFVITASIHVKTVKLLGQIRVLHPGAHLVQSVLRIAEGIAEIKQRQIFPGDQGVRPVVDVILPDAILLHLGEIQVQNQIFYLIMLQNIGGVRPIVAHVAAIGKEVVEARVHVLVELPGAQRRGAGGADHIGVKPLMILLQPCDLGCSGVIILIIAVPIENRVAEHSEGIDQHIRRGIDHQHQRHCGNSRPSRNTFSAFHDRCILPGQNSGMIFLPFFSGSSTFLCKTIPCCSVSLSHKFPVFNTRFKKRLSHPLCVDMCT